MRIEKQRFVEDEVNVGGERTFIGSEGNPIPKELGIEWRIVGRGRRVRIEISFENVLS